jgi:hypothetical protein
LGPGGTYIVDTVKDVKDSCGTRVAKVVYKGKGADGMDHTAVWVNISAVTAVHGWSVALKKYELDLKLRAAKRKATKNASRQNETVIASTSATTTISQQSIYNDLIEVSIARARAHTRTHTRTNTHTQGKQQLTTAESSRLWDEAGVE